MGSDQGQVQDGDVILGGTCKGTVSVGQCRGYAEWRWGGAEGVTTVTRAA
jgi:hypothetical protein